MKNSYFENISLEVITFDGKSEKSSSTEKHAKILLNWIKNGK